MQVGTLAIQFIFEKDVLYSVPLYQRPYVWTAEEQWQPLWDDLQRVADQLLQGKTPRAHFLGASVQDVPPVPPGTIETRLLIDGQQRLTTLQLLLKAFQDLVQSETDNRYFSAIQKLTRNTHPLIQNTWEEFKLWPTNADRDDFRRTMEAGDRKALLKDYGCRSNAKSVGRNIPDGYLFFTDRIQEWLDDEESGNRANKIPALYSAIRDHVRLVVIDLDDKDDAQLIFETLNARGTPLLSADLIKNYLLNELQAAGENTESAYEKYWRPFDYDAGFWRAETGRGHAKRAVIEIFLQHTLTLITKEEVTAGHLYPAFRDFRRSNSDYPAIDLLEDFKRYGSIYRELQNWHHNPRISLFQERIWRLDIGTIYPFLLRLFDLLGTEDEKLIAVISDVESFLMRRMVCRLSTRGYNRLFLDLTKSLDEDDIVVAAREELLSGTAEHDRWPSDDEFQKAWLNYPLYENITRPRLRLLLEALEMGLRNKFAETHDVPRNLTVEHVLPQSWEAHWPLPEGADQTEFTLERNLILHTIGNLTLLNDKLNPVQSNNPWVMGDEPESGKRAGLQENSVLFLNKELCKHDAWNEDNIRERSASLFEIALETWPRP